jgi:hypothetical protein
MRRLTGPELTELVNDYSEHGFEYAPSMFTPKEFAPLANALDIVKIGGSQGTDPAAIDRALDTQAAELGELASGDLVVFHSNLLHGSGANHVQRQNLTLGQSVRRQEHNSIPER